MEIKDRKESKLLNRAEVSALFKEKPGSLTRMEAVKMIADEMKVDEKRIALLSLKPEAGSTDVIGTFHVYHSDEKMNVTRQKYLGIRLLTKGERQTLKEAKKKAKQPKAK